MLSNEYMNVDYYAVLEVSKNATKAQIKEAYLSKIKRYHPELNPRDEAIVKTLNQAFKVLFNDKLRYQYDNPPIIPKFNSDKQKKTEPKLDETNKNEINKEDRSYEKLAESYEKKRELRQQRYSEYKNREKDDIYLEEFYDPILIKKEWVFARRLFSLILDLMIIKAGLKILMLMFWFNGYVVFFEIPIMSQVLCNLLSLMLLGLVISSCGTSIGKKVFGVKIVKNDDYNELPELHVMLTRHLMMFIMTGLGIPLFQPATTFFTGYLRYDFEGYTVWDKITDTKCIFTHMSKINIFSKIMITIALFIATFYF